MAIYLDGEAWERLLGNTELGGVCGLLARNRSPASRQPRCIMKKGDNYLDPKQRAALERQVFEARRDVLYFEGKAKYAAGHGDDGVPEAVVREAFNRHMEKDWPAEQRAMKKLSDARLQDRMDDAVERLDAIGCLQRVAERYLPLASDDYAPDWDLSKVKPVTRSLIESIFLDVEPTPAALNDFGITSQAHYEAIAYPVRDDQITFAELDAAYGNGAMLTELVNAAPSNPHKGITFETPWDHVLGRVGGNGQPPSNEHTPLPEQTRGRRR